ncbi:hypothetical protein Tco_0266335 [Tanacetum coccineum]
MAQQLQAEEQEQLSIEEKSKLFVQLLEARKKHFAEIRAREKGNKPPTQAQQRKIYSFKRVNTFVDFRTEFVEGAKKMEESSMKDKAETIQESSSKRAGGELESNKSKKRKLNEKVEAEVDDNKEAEGLKQFLEIVPDDGDDVTIDATPLFVKIPIVDYKIHQEGKKRFFLNYQSRW